MKSSDRSLNGLAEIVSALRAELDAAEQHREAAEVARRRAEEELKAVVQRHEEQMMGCQRNTKCSQASVPLVSLSSSLSSLPYVQPADLGATSVRPGHLLDELKGVAYNSVEQKLRKEFQDARGELEKQQQQDAAAAAADAAGVEMRLSQMHAGTVFGKVSFKRSVKQSRYVRLTFDCSRVEWAQHQRGPFNSVLLNSIIRVDYGDTSRAFRCFEFGRHDRPPPGLCLSICTSTRSLDLIASSERDVEVWMLGLNELIPYHLERQRFTVQDFFLRRAMIHLEADKRGRDYENESARANGQFPYEADCPINGNGSKKTAGVSAAGSGSSRGLSGRWGFPFKR